MIKNSTICCKWFLLTLLLAVSQLAHGQTTWQWEGGLSFSLGQPTNRVGLSFRIKYYQGQVGVNAEVGSWYRFSGMGAPGHRWESRIGLGPSIGFGPQQSLEDLTFTYQTPFQSELSYLFLRYQEKHTPQFSGRLNMNFNGFSIGLENDFLGWMGRDRFRTGTLEFAYTKGNDRLALELALWTGETRCEEMERVDAKDAQYGLKLINDCPYGKISHGLLRLKYSARVYPNQQVSLSLGIDDERIRHIFQNKLMHDWLLSLNKKVKNPHFPMLDQSGMPIIDSTNQEVRKARLAWAFELNRWSIY